MLGLLATSLAAHSAVIKTIDLTPIGGTSISDITSPSGVRFDFGYGNGPGRVWLTSLTAGSTFNLLTISSFPNETAPLDNGDQFVTNNAVVFDLQGPGGGRGGPAGFVLNIALDSGVLTAGSLFEIYSLDRRDGANNNGAQYFEPGQGMGAVDSHQLPSDGVIPLVDTGGVFSAQSVGVSAGRGWRVGGVNSFQGTFSQDMRYGGVGFSIAVAEVPEPASVLLVLVSLGALVATRKRNQTPVRLTAS